MSAYCDSAPGTPVHGPYHDDEYGVPATDNRVLFERLCMEILQAGLSWDLILKRRAGLNAAFDDFDPVAIAGYGEDDVARLLADKRIIRNRLKVAAIVKNAKVVVDMQASHGSFHNWLASHHPLTHKQWTALFRETLGFTGPEVVNEFLMSLGWLPGAHRADCLRFKEILALKPPWASAESAGFRYG